MFFIHFVLFFHIGLEIAKNISPKSLDYIGLFFPSFLDHCEE